MEVGLWWSLVDSAVLADDVIAITNQLCQLHYEGSVYTNCVSNTQCKCCVRTVLKNKKVK